MEALIYGSVCSGIEAASAAWGPLGWRCAFVSEIEAFPSAVLQHHYPDVPNLGDMTKFKEWPDAAIDALVGGTPCQSFSVAGLRKGLDDPRGNLMLTYLAIVERFRPRWVAWENVPGVLSVDGGRAFGAFLGGLAKLGYGFAYRILDAQFFGVPQRRRRVFVVGCLGDWRRAAAVLFERHSLSGHPAPRRETGQRPAPTISARTKGGGGLGTNFDCDGGLIAAPHADISPAIKARDSKGASSDGDGDSAILVPMVAQAVTSDARHARIDQGRGTLVPIAIQGAATRENPDSGPDGVGVRTDGMAYTLEARQEVQAVAVPIDMRQASRGEKMTNNRAEGSSGGAPGTGIGKDGDPTPTVASSHVPAIAVALRGREGGATAELSEVPSALRASGGGGGGDKAHALVAMAVRRLTPRECERLQGFSDDYSLVPYRNKPAADGPRYKALGNSMAVPVMAWIGRAIALVDGIK